MMLIPAMHDVNPSNAASRSKFDIGNCVPGWRIVLEPDTAHDL